ncbi:MAG TPA: hypothetical protein VHY75_04900 [Steroidobacteraceae bacterium]|nr:hypothetical protein [Steroidobacteraceae bacterium]
MALGLTTAATLAAPSLAQDFSADIVSRDAAGVPIGTGARLYVAKRKVRIETPEASTGFFLVDGATGTALFVRPAQRVFMSAKQSTRLTQLFVPVNPKDPCPQWQAATENAGVPGAGSDWRCERIGSSIVADRDTIEYRVIPPQQPPSRRWIDPKLDIPVKLRAADGTTIALEHIRVEVQPASLFAVPPDYRRLDPQELIYHIKHSDVWVDPPN